MPVFDFRSLGQRGKALGYPDRVILSAGLLIGPMQRVRELVYHDCAQPRSLE